MGLAAFYKGDFVLARKHFRESARRKMEAAERKKKEAAQDLVSSGEAAYAGGKYAEAIGGGGRLLPIENGCKPPKPSRT